MQTDLAFINGRVITMKEGGLQEAAAVSGDRIAMVGTTGDILAVTGPDTRIIDLKGRALLPGFIDTHVHLVGYGASFSAIDLLDVRSIAELTERCRSHIKENNIPDGTWVFGRGFNQNDFTDRAAFPTAANLNGISTVHPILLLRTCGHIGSANDLALELAGVDRHTAVRGGVFDVRADGSPNGVMREAALEWFKARIAGSGTVDSLKQAILSGGRALARFGITSVHTEDSYDLGYAGDIAHIHEAYRQLTEENAMPVRVYRKVSLPRQADLAEFLKQPLRTGHGNDYFRMGPMKLWADGTLGARTASLIEPYTDAPDQSGILLYGDDELADMVKTAQENDMQACIHSIGDRSLDQVVRCYERVGGRDMRHRIVHCQIGNPELYARIGRLGLCVNIQPVQTATDFPLIEHRLGRERASVCHAWQTCLDAGVTLTGSSDVPCSYDAAAADVFSGIHAIVNRDRWLPGEAVTVYEALKMYTVNAAWSAFQEDIKGTIEPGKLADLVVADQNPLTADKARLREIRVDSTFLGGRQTAGES